MKHTHLNDDNANEGNPKKAGVMTEGRYFQSGPQVIGKRLTASQGGPSITGQELVRELLQNEELFFQVIPHRLECCWPWLMLTAAQQSWTLIKGTICRMG